MKHLAIGVAGHVDHGKTSLVQALTGIDTDRLKEEKERGMSIVLGFAPLTLPGEGIIDFIDAPGHERFVGTMIAGASGIDALLLVIAATERIKPQTIEHLALAELLGIRRGLVAVTKSDLLEGSAEREESARQIKAFLAGTLLKDAPLVFTSAVTGDGLDTLRAELAVILQAVSPQPAGASYYLPIDRSFVLPGQGTIVTGTLHRKELRAGETIEIVPQGRRVEVRGLQVHGRDVPAVEPGWRAAVNLRGVKRDEIRSGSALAAPGALRATNTIDAELRLLPDLPKPLARGGIIRLHFGTADVNARVYPLGELAPGETGHVQFRLPEAVAAPAGTPFVIRSLSPAATLGGGRLLDLHPTRKSKLTADERTLLETLSGDNVSCKLALKLREAGMSGRLLDELARDLDIRPETVQQLDADIVLCAHGIAVHREPLESLESEIKRMVAAFHNENPRAEAVPRGALLSKAPIGARSEVFDKALERLTAAGDLLIAGGAVRLTAFTPQPLPPDDARILEGIENSFRRAKLQPPETETVTRSDPARRELLRLLLRSGRLIETTDRSTGRAIVFHVSAIAAAEQLLSTLAASQLDGFTVSDAARLLGTTRKYAIPLLEYLDASGKTRRIGDRRVVSQ